ncbi:protein root UVB sensitive 6-like [Senna tora]|uniref:Protein root UVB sensitive 6-like n=1 Tax=Senna tora TaxID=362788 RepID=A0A835C5M8_9FABA|nr:protein root UVB sensitive 6-like [Senna tora]
MPYSFSSSSINSSAFRNCLILKPPNPSAAAAQTISSSQDARALVRETLCISANLASSPAVGDACPAETTFEEWTAVAPLDD